MLVVGYTFTDSYDLILHTGCGRLRECETLAEFLTCHGDTLIVQADGDELEVIRNQISGIRMTRNRVVRWRGGDAQFILENLKL